MTDRIDSFPPPKGKPVPCVPLSTVRLIVAVAYGLGFLACVAVVQIMVNWQ